MSNYPPIRIERDLWAVMRYRPDQPAAMIYRITDRQQISQYLVMTWHPDPSQRRLDAMYDSLEAADASVKWESTGIRTGREGFGPTNTYVPEATIDGAPYVDPEA